MSFVRAAYSASARGNIGLHPHISTLFTWPPRRSRGYFHFKIPCSVPFLSQIQYQSTLAPRTITKSNSASGRRKLNNIEVRVLANGCNYQQAQSVLIQFPGDRKCLINCPDELTRILARDLNASKNDIHYVRFTSDCWANMASAKDYHLIPHLHETGRDVSRRQRQGAQPLLESKLHGWQMGVRSADPPNGARNHLMNTPVTNVFSEIFNKYSQDIVDWLCDIKAILVQSESSSVVCYHCQVPPPSPRAAVSDVPRSVLVIECPEADLIEGFLQSAELAKIADSSTLGLVVHMTPSPIFNSPEYKKFLNRFSSSTSHLVLNGDNPGHPQCVTVTESLHKILTGISTEYFLPLYCSREEPAPTYSANIQGAFMGSTYRVTADGIGHQTLRTLTGLYSSETPQAASPSSALTPSATSYPQVVFMGTGAAESIQRRGSANIIVQLSEDQSMLLDCGTGSFSKAVSTLGKEGMEKLLVSLRAIFISHCHVDHFYGLFNWLAAIQKCLDARRIDRPIYVIGPKKLYEQAVPFLKHPGYHYLRNTRFLMCPNSQKKADLLFSTCSRLSNRDDKSQEAMISRVKEILGLAQLCPIVVRHARDMACFGLTLRTNDRWKLTYSGDTMPCPGLVQYGRNSNLLIHEATYCDAFIHLSAKVRHSTFSQAVKIGEEMKAKQTILTHFSAGDAVVPSDFAEPDLPKNVHIAFDGMKVTRDNLSKLHEIKDPLLMHFHQQMQWQNAKNEHRYSRNMADSGLSVDEILSRL